MLKNIILSHRALSAAPLLALVFALAPVAVAQDAPTTTQSQTPQTQTQPQQAAPPAPASTQTAAADRTGAQVASAPAGEAVAAQVTAWPLYREYKGVTLGMSAADVRAKLGKPEVQSDEVDIFVLSERERVRVHYDKDRKASAVIATFIGKDANAPAPAAVLGTDIEAKPDGSMYRMTPYPQAGYWVAYSRTPGDSPMVIITMQKSN